MVDGNVIDDMIVNHFRTSTSYKPSKFSGNLPENQALSLYIVQVVYITHDFLMNLVKIGI